MTKETILAHFGSATKSQQKRLTQDAREWLSSKKIYVDRRSLAYWRANDMGRSPLAALYQKAYQIAIEKQMAALAANS